MTYAVAVAQTCPVKGDVSANIAEHLELARLAAAEGARVVVFPELSLTGYEIDLGESLAFEEADPRLAPLIAAAKELGLILVVGAPVRLDSARHIGAFILYPDGTTELYTKQRMGKFPPSASCDGVVPPAEATVFRAGDRNPLVRLGEERAAVAVCADIGNPLHPQQAAERGAGIYLASMFVIPSEFDGEVARLSRYAAQHSLLVAFANFGGPTGGLCSAGRSGIWSEAGELLVQLDAAGSGVAVVAETAAGRRTCVRRSD